MNFNEYITWLKGVFFNYLPGIHIGVRLQTLNLNTFPFISEFWHPSKLLSFIKPNYYFVFGPLIVEIKTKHFPNFLFCKSDWNISKELIVKWSVWCIIRALDTMERYLHTEMRLRRFVKSHNWGIVLRLNRIWAQSCSSSPSTIKVQQFVLKQKHFLF